MSKTLKTYIEDLQKFAKENPECLDLQVIDSNYNRIWDEPVKGKLNVEPLRSNGFTDIENFEDFSIDPSEVNAVQI